jgi:hypothetical protein
MCYLFYFSSQCRKSSKLIGLANAFSGGLFMGIALFHLFPESNESFEEYFASPEGQNSEMRGLPMTFFIAFCAYSLILLFEKVAFDSHSLTEHTHEGHHDIAEIQSISNDDKEATTPLVPIKENEHEEETKGVAEIKEDLADSYFGKHSNKRLWSPIIKSKSNEKAIYSDCFALSFKSNNTKNFSMNEGKKDIHEDDEDSDEDEQILKNVVSSKGKFASYLQARNLSKKNIIIKYSEIS